MICAREGWPSRECKPVWCTPIRAAQNHDKIQNSEFWYQLVYNSLTTDNINGPSGLQRAEQTSGRLLEREQCMYVMTALFPAICGPWNNGNYCHLQIVNFASDLWAFCSRVYRANSLSPPLLLALITGRWHQQQRRWVTNVKQCSLTFQCSFKTSIKHVLQTQDTIFFKNQTRNIINICTQSKPRGHVRVWVHTLVSWKVSEKKRNKDLSKWCYAIIIKTVSRETRRVL